VEEDEGGGVKLSKCPTKPEGITGEIVEVGNVFGFLAPVQRGATTMRRTTSVRVTKKRI
jgi:hypothetical protein